MTIELTTAAERTPNRVYDAAIAVFREHAAGIKLKQTGPSKEADFVLSVKMPEYNPEIESAFNALAPQCYTSYAEVDGISQLSIIGNKPVNLRQDETAILSNPAGSVAATLALHGINFPGSERFKVTVRGQ